MTSISDKSRNRDRFIKSIKVKLTDDIYSKLQRHYYKDLSEMEKFLTELKLSYSEKDRTLEGPLHALKEALSKVLEEVNKIENERKKSDHAEVHSDVGNNGDQAKVPNKELMRGNDEQIKVNYNDDENEVGEKGLMSNNETIVSGSFNDDDDDVDVDDDDDDDSHCDEDERNGKVKVSQRKENEKVKKDGDIDDDQILKNENLTCDMSGDDLLKLSAGDETKEIKKSKFPVQSGSNDSEDSQKSGNEQSEEQGKHRPGDEKKSGNGSRSDTPSQTFNRTTSHPLDQPSIQRENLENFPNSSNELERLEFQSNHENDITTMKLQASERLNSVDNLLSQEAYSSSRGQQMFFNMSFNMSFNATGRHQRDPQITEVVGITKQSEAENVPSTQSRNESDSSTDSDFEKTEESDSIKTGLAMSNDSSENNVGGSAKEIHSNSKMSNSKQISKKTLFLKDDGKANPTPNKYEMLEKINQHVEIPLRKNDPKDVASENGLAGVHQIHARHSRKNPISERINLSSGSSTVNDKMSTSDLCKDADETEKGWQASSSERRMDQPHKSVESSLSGSSHTRGISSEKWRLRSQSESERNEENSRLHASVHRSETFPIPNVYCDLNILKGFLKAENKLEHIKIELNQAKENILCTISGGNEEEMRKTKKWLIDFIETNIQDNDTSSRIEIQFIINSKTAFEKDLCLQKNVLCFAVKCVEGYFIALRRFLSRLTRSYSRLHFNHRTKEIIIIFTGDRDKLDAENKLIYENDIKISSHPFVEKMPQNIVAKVSQRMPDVFVEFNDDTKYFIIGDNKEFVDECRKTAPKNKKYLLPSLHLKNVNTCKFVSLKVEIVRNELSKADACRFVIFGDCDKNILLLKFGFKDCTKSSIEKLSQDVELVNMQDSKKLYLIRKPKHSAQQSHEEELRDLYRIALYHASDGTESLAMTLTRIAKCGLEVSSAILREVIRDYDHGKRVHDRLKKLAIVSNDLNHYKVLKSCFN